MNDQEQLWSDDTVEWPESDLDIDDDAFADAIAKGRELPEAA